MALTKEDLAEIERWHFRSDANRCKCNDCNRLNNFARHYFAVRAGAAFNTTMLEGLNEHERETFVKMICLRSLEEK